MLQNIMQKRVKDEWDRQKADEARSDSPLSEVMHIAVPGRTTTTGTRCLVLSKKNVNSQHFRRKGVETSVQCHIFWCIRYNHELYEGFKEPYVVKTKLHSLAEDDLGVE
ncbi:jg21571 [Pararge aegeria aegeria]|uniref:Jg21571 protein n=1 Tax=Pararge aegeria aegeria TaxID=348720 RepID=A0A8S4RSU1_9NEOP|nr:jg21571 [Pararge aegeria aegeria]